MTETSAVSLLRKGALSALREGRVSVKYARTSGADLTVTEVIARVRSSRDDGGSHAVDFRAGQWRCSCRMGRQGDNCAHQYAVALTTTGVEEHG